MKTKFVLFMLFAAITLNAQHKLSIVVEGIEAPAGHVIVGLYDQENFMKKPVTVQIVEVTAETITVVLENLPPGEYAVSLFQDENDNGKLDTGLFGIPTEKYGFSRNAKGKYGPPSYEECKFTLDGDLEIFIML